MVYEVYQTPTEPTELSATDSLVLVDKILDSKEPNELLKTLFSKNNEEILNELLVRKQGSSK